MTTRKVSRLSVYDFDGTLFSTFHPEDGKPKWEKYYNKKYPHKGWWSKPESLDTEVFDIKPITSVHSLLQRDVNDLETYVIILTNRITKLRPQLENILNLNKIKVDELITKEGNRTKDIVVKDFLDRYPELEQIDIYDDMSSNIDDFKTIRPDLPNGLTLNIYQVNNGKIFLVESTKKMVQIIHDEIKRIIN